MTSGIADFLLSTELFSSIDPEIIEELVPELRAVALRDGEVLVSKGDMDRHVYLSARLKSADLYLHPNLLKFKRTDFHLADDMSNAGYQCMRKDILDWLNQPQARARRPDLAEIVSENLRTAI